MLRWRIDNNEVAEGENFPALVVLDYTLYTFDEKTYGVEKNELGFVTKIKIPATVFETKANALFGKFSLTELRTAEIYDSYDEEAGKALYRQCYNAAENAYIFNGMGGLGDSTAYRVFGYTGTEKCTVYSAFIDLAEELDTAPSGKTEGKDYIRYDGKFYMVIHWLKTVVEKGSEVKFHSWQKVSAVPTTGLTRNDATLEKPASNTSSATSSTTSGAASSAASSVSSSTSSASSEAQNETVSDGSSTENDVIYETVAETEEVTVQAAEKAFPEGTVVAVVPVTEGKVFETATSAMKEKATKFVAFDITATKENATVQPDGTVKAEFAVPEGYDLDKVCVLYIDDNGNTEIMPSTVDKATGKVVATLSHFSVYVVAEMIEAVSADTAKADSSPALLIIIIVAAVLVLCGGAAAWYFLYYKKKTANE